MKTDRIRDRMDRMGLSQAGLARAVGATQGAIQQILDGSTQRSRFLPDIAAALGVTTSYLLGSTDDPTSQGVLEGRPSPEETLEELGLTRVQEIEVSYGMGGGTFIEDYPETRWKHFDLNWLSEITRSPPQSLFVATGVGDSMFPTLLDNDTLLIDRAQARITQQDRIWALTYGEVGMVKRLRRLPAGKLLVMSDNAVIENFEASDEEVRLIGRLVWIGRKA